MTEETHTAERVKGSGCSESPCSGSETPITDASEKELEEFDYLTPFGGGYMRAKVGRDLERENVMLRSLLSEALEHIETYDDGMAGWLTDARRLFSQNTKFSHDGSSASGIASNDCSDS